MPELETATTSSARWRRAGRRRSRAPPDLRPASLDRELVGEPIGVAISPLDGTRAGALRPPHLVEPDAQVSDLEESLFRSACELTLVDC
jgi:hypothetical protein